MNAASQKERILKHCEKYGSITVRDAVVILNINSPTKRISELRQMGYIVEKETVTKTLLNGEKSRFDRYFIRKGECCG